MRVFLWDGQWVDSRCLEAWGTKQLTFLHLTDPFAPQTVQGLILILLVKGLKPFCFSGRSWTSLMSALENLSFGISLHLPLGKAAVVSIQKTHHMVVSCMHSNKITRLQVVSTKYHYWNWVEASISAIWPINSWCTLSHSACIESSWDFLAVNATLRAITNNMISWDIRNLNFFWSSFWNTTF